jgi:uncharacterized YccA/Bax inhibitor family protein
MDNKTWLTRTGNPGLNDRTFAGLPRASVAGEAMTLQGTINKAFLLLVVLLAAALWPWSQFFASADPASVAPAVLTGLIGGLVFGLIISFKPTLAPYLSIPYAACEGLLIGGISAVLEKRYPGIAIQAVGLTIGVMAALLLAYTMRIIRVTQRHFPALPGVGRARLVPRQCVLSQRCEPAEHGGVARHHRLRCAQSGAGLRPD